MVDTSFEAIYPDKIVEKYSKVVHRASVCNGDGVTYLGPKIQTDITCLGIQHFAVIAAPDDVLIEEFKSNDGPAAFEKAVHLAEARGLPWTDHLRADVFDPATGERWTYRVTQVPQANVRGELMGHAGKHDWAVGEKCENGYLVFVDDRPVSYRPTPFAAKELALEIIDRLKADGDYRLNDKPAGFTPPPLSTPAVS